MKFEMKKTFIRSIQSSLGIYKDVAKKLSNILIAIMEDPRKRYTAISNKFIELENLKGQYWCIKKKIHTRCIFKQIENEKESIEFSKELIVKIKFWWGYDGIKLLEAEYLLIPAETMEAWNHDTMTFSFFDRNITMEKRWDKREIIFCQHSSSEILEILDICKIFPQESCERYFIGMKSNLYYALNPGKELSVQNKSSNRLDPRNDKYIREMIPGDSEIKKYFNKDDSILITEAEFQKFQEFLSTCGFSRPLSQRIRLKETSIVS